MVIINYVIKWITLVIYFIIALYFHVVTLDIRLNGSMDPTMSPKWDVSLPNIE